MRFDFLVDRFTLVSRYVYSCSYQNKLRWPILFSYSLIKPKGIGVLTLYYFFVCLLKIIALNCHQFSNGEHWIHTFYKRTPFCPVLYNSKMLAIMNELCDSELSIYHLQRLNWASPINRRSYSHIQEREQLRIEELIN